MPVRTGNWLKRVEALHGAGAIRPGSATYASIAHDEWCDVWHNGFCNCDPEITLTDLDGPADN